MDKYLAYLPIIFFAFCISFALTPLIIFLARRFGAIDQPKTKRSEGDRTRERRIHRKPTPKLGGVPVFFSFVAVALLFLNPTTELLGFLGIVSVLFFMGIYDDIYEISAGKQFIFQIFAAVSASLFLKLPFVSLFGIDIDLNWLQYESGGLNISFPGDLLIFAWIILLINSIKWSAGADAVMEGNVLIGSVIIFLVSVRTFDPVSAVIAAALGGALLGFLPYNISPAKIFSGSSGKSVYGFIIAVVAIFSQSKLAITFAVTLLPLIDALTVLYFRQKKHKPKNFFQLMRINDKTHLHHLLLERVPSHRKVALIEWSVTLLVGVVALLFAGAELAAAITVVLILLIIGGFYLRRNLLST